MLELLNGYKSYKLPSGGTLDVLRNVSIKVTPGESLAILGRVKSILWCKFPSGFPLII
jgi:ABC-type glutathione transport system ATPase component